LSKKNISQLDLRLDIETDHFEDFNIFYSQDLLKIDNIKIPNIIKFYRADKFDTKFINSNNDVWEYYYSGSRVYLNFSKFNKYQKKLAKYLFAIYIQYNSPSNLSGKLTAYRYLINELVSKEEKLNFKNIKNILEGIVDKYQQYYFIKFMAKQLFLENFYKFNEDQEYDLEFIKRPSSFNSNLYYQEYEDRIDYPLITMIQQGFTALNYDLVTKPQSVKDDTLLYTSILGLVYISGLRPVQLAKLSVNDIKQDTTRDLDNFHRYSILIPYAKQARYIHEKIAVKLPEEVANIVLAYIARYKLCPDEKLFNMGDNAAKFCQFALNTQLFDFSPEAYKSAVLCGEMIQQKYSYSDFRHHVGYSLAMAGSTAEEIAYILGHSSLATARHYIFSTPEMAQIRAQALGRNALYKQMIAMLLTGRLVYKKNWRDKRVLGNIGANIHHDIGGCSYKEKCLFQPVRNCYGCIYFHPFVDADHTNVLNSIQEEINDLIKLSDGIGISRNPLIRVHESTKFEIESVIMRCKMYKEDNYEY
jgi:integrase